MNIQLSSESRQTTIQDALKIVKNSRASMTVCNKREFLRRKQHWAENKISCPLLKNGICQIGDERPLRCHLTQSSQLKDYDKVVGDLSGDVFSALTGYGQKHIPLSFPMHDIVSGRFVQHYFQAMLNKISSK